MWRDTARSSRFFMVEGLAAAPLLVFLLHISWGTFWFAVIDIAVFWVLERFGVTVPVALRLLRRFIGGTDSAAVPSWRKHG